MARDKKIRPAYALGILNYGHSGWPELEAERAAARRRRSARWQARYATDYAAWKLEMKVAPPPVDEVDELLLAALNAASFALLSAAAKGVINRSVSAHLQTVAQDHAASHGRVLLTALYRRGHLAVTEYPELDLELVEPGLGRDLVLSIDPVREPVPDFNNSETFEPQQGPAVR